MKKKLIGYKLIKPEYEKAALLLINETSFRDFNYGGRVDTQQPTNIAIYKNAGVLDLWFEPVYEEEIKTVRMGGSEGFDLTVKNNKVFHKSEDITQYIKDIYNSFSAKSRRVIAGYDFHAKDVILCKTGCENKETKLSEWLALYDMIK